MKRLLILTFILLLLMSVSSMATNTRVLTMGDNNNVLLDDANIWLYPSRVFEYPNLAIGEFGDVLGETTDDFAQFGIHWKFGSDNPWVLGTYFTELPAVYPDDLWGNDLVPFDWSLLTNRRIDLFYGNALGDYNFGSRISLFHSSQTNEISTPPGDQSKEAFSFYDFDFGLTPSTGEWDVALNFGFGGWTDEDATGATETESDGFYDFSLMGRYFHQSGPNYTYIPHVGIMYSKHNMKDLLDIADPADDLTDKNTGTAFDLGLGLNYTPATNVLAVCDFGLLYAKLKHEEEVAGVTTVENSERFTVLPYFKIGLDADVFKWMDIRLGATSFWTRETDEDKVANDKMKFNSARNETFLGFGFHWNRLHIDTYTHPEVFLNGFDFISGSGNGDMNFRISAVYEMM